MHARRLGLVLSFVMLALPAAAQDFYQGRTITLVVGSAVGGGFDINARMLARHLPRHIPGRPDIVVQNLAGAGSLSALRHVENAAPRDGTHIVSFNFGLIGISKLTPAKAPIDFRKLGWIGSISEDLTTCYTWGALGLRTLADVKARSGLHFGLAAAGGNEDINARVLRTVLGVPLKQVGGYPGSAQQRLAIERGELDGGCGSWNSLPEDWVTRRLVNPIYRTGPATSDMPAGLPLVLDLAPGPRERAIIRLLTAHNELGRPFVTHAAVPADRLAILRQAFDKAVRDPELLADAARLRMPVSPRSAIAALAIVDDIYAAPDDIVSAARQVLE